MKIRNKLTIYFLIILLVPTSVLSFVFLRNSQINLKNQLINKLETIIDYKKNELEQFSELNTDIIKIIAGTTSLTKNFAQYNNTPTKVSQDALISELNYSLNSLEGLETISLIDLSGIMIASTDGSELGKNFSREPFFIEGKNKAGAYFIENGTLILAFVAPVIDDGQVIGLARSIVRLNTLEKIIANKTGLGKTDEVLLAIKSSNGNPVFVIKRQFENQAIIDAKNITQVVDAINGEEKIIDQTNNYRGIKVTAITRYIKNLKAGLIIEANQDEINSSLKTILVTTLVVTLFSILLSILVAWFLSNDFSNPIKKLTEITKKISVNNLPVSFSKELLESQDEIGLLSRNFKSMTDTLTDTYQGLNTSLKYSKQLISAANVMIVGLDLDGRVIIFNEAAEKITGYSKDEVVGRNWFELIVPRDRFPETWKVFEKFQKQGKSISGEFENPILTKNGEERIIEWRNSDLYDNNYIIGTISYGIDITKQKLTEKENHHLASFPQLTPIAIIEFNQKAEVLFVNPAMDAIIKELVINDSRQLIPLVWQKKLAESIWDKGEIAVEEVEFSGHIFEERIAITPESQSLRIFMTDVTERKKEKDMLQESEARYKAIITVSNTGAWEYHRSTDYLWCSPEYFTMLGYNPADFEMSGKANLKEIWIDLLHPEDREKASSNFAEYLKNGSIGMYENYFRLSHKNGSWVWIWSRGQTLKTKDGDLTDLTVGTHIDITEQKLEEEKLKELDKLKDNFLSIATHELRTPLTPIKSQAQLLLKGDYGPLNQEQERAIAMIARNEENLNRLTNDLMAISKIKSNKLILILEKVELNQIITDVLKDLESLAQEKNIIISFLPPVNLPQIMADKLKITQIMNNLIGNALKFTPENGQINIDSKNINNTIIITVKDTGIGLSPENLNKLFTPFFQVQNDLNRKYRGTGLGLAITKGIIEAHGGKIWVESAGEEQGSSFIFSLPIN